MHNSVSFGREVASTLLKIVAILLTLGLIFGGLLFMGDTYTGISDGSCNIAVLPIKGEIVPLGHGSDYAVFSTTPADVREFIENVHRDTTGTIEGVLFEVNSPGGTPVASEDIASQIKNLDFPNAVLIGDLGVSGGYMIASASNRIFASAMSEIGSIGVTMSYVENSEKNKKEGLTYVPLTTGKYKDAGSPDKPLSAEDRSYFQSQLDIIYNEFITLVARNRNLSEGDVRTIADGSTLIGQQAVDKKLVDEIGDREAVRRYFAEKLQKDVSNISLCEYKAPLQII